MNLKHLLKITGDTPSTYGVLLTKTHAKACSPHTFVEIKLDDPLPLDADECVLLDERQVKQIDSEKSFVFHRIDNFLVVNNVQIAIQKRKDVPFVAESQIGQIRPRIENGLTIRINPFLLADVQRALSEGHKEKGITITIPLDNPNAAYLLKCNGNEGVFMPMRVEVNAPG